MKHNTKVSALQREEILLVHLTEGVEAGSAISRKYGLGPNYARKLASERGYKPVVIPTGTLRTGETA